MSDSRAAALLSALPQGWSPLGQEHKAGFARRLEGEVSREHRLSGVPVEAVATRDANDDVLYRHIGEPERFTVVHLTWAGRRETTPCFPSVEFDGTFAEFLECERRNRLADDS